MKLALVTGGGRGIGAAIARRLADEGCVVGILDLDAAGGEKVAGEIKAKGGKVSFHATDISDYDAVKRAVEALEAASGPVSFLVNNAGWDRAANFLETTPEFWRAVVDINLFGPLNVSHAVLHYFRRFDDYLDRELTQVTSGWRSSTPRWPRAAMVFALPVMPSGLKLIIATPFSPTNKSSTSRSKAARCL